MRCEDIPSFSAELSSSAATRRFYLGKADAQRALIVRRLGLPLDQPSQLGTPARAGDGPSLVVYYSEGDCFPIEGARRSTTTTSTERSSP